MNTTTPSSKCQVAGSAGMAIPGPAGKRLRWRDLSDRTGDPIVPLDHATILPFPSRHAFPSARRQGSWPASIKPPTEGSLDWESFCALAAVLRAFSGPETVVYAHWCEAITAEAYTVFEGRLADLELLLTFRRAATDHNRTMIRAMSSCVPPATPRSLSTASAIWSGLRPQ